MKTEARLAQWLLASVFIVMGGYRLWQALNGIPVANGTLVLSAGEMLLGILILVGWQLRALCLVAASLLAADAALSHAFWRLAGSQQGVQLLQFMKNIGLIGGLILLSSSGGAKRR